MKKHKIALAGCGSMAKAWITYVLQRNDAEIVALIDLYPEAAEKTKTSYNLQAQTYSNVRTAIEETGANLLFDVTIPASHFEVASTAMELGCNVMSEKPMANSMEEARKLLVIAQAQGRFYAIMQNRRYQKQIRAYQQIVSTGKIGEPGFIAADFFLGPHFGGFREAMDSPLILDMAIHTFDQARFVTGQDPISVYCHEFNPPGSWYKGAASAVCIFEFGNGAVFNYRGSWCAEGAPTSWESNWRIVGSKGTAIWDGTNNPYYELPSPSEGLLHPATRYDVTPDWNGQAGHTGCLDEMFAALNESRHAETDATDNIKSMAMVYGAIQSAQEGRKISLI